tara:strand:+ start:1131 stop:1352 length:222 start_codon:yes stop_codon:yes gene_type:complete
MLNNSGLDNILKNNIIKYLEEPIKVLENDYDSTKILTFYNKQKLKRKLNKNKNKYRYTWYCIHIILFYILFNI